MARALALLLVTMPSVCLALGDLEELLLLSMLQRRGGLGQALGMGGGGPRVGCARASGRLSDPGSNNDVFNNNNAGGGKAGARAVQFDANPAPLIREDSNLTSSIDNATLERLNETLASALHEMKSTLVDMEVNRKKNASSLVVDEVTSTTNTTSKTRRRNAQMKQRKQRTNNNGDKFFPADVLTSMFGWRSKRAAPNTNDSGSDRARAVAVAPERHRHAKKKAMSPGVTVVTGIGPDGKKRRIGTGRPMANLMEAMREQILDVMATAG